MTSASTLALCCLGMLMLLLVSPVASAASSTPPPSVRGSRLARLLTESEPPRLLTLSECRALPVSFGASENSFGSDHCPGMIYYAPGFGYNNDQGICLFFTGQPASYADAQADCASMDADAVLLSPRDDAERCLMTDLVDAVHNSYLTGIIDAQADGVYVDHEGVPIPDVYLNWAFVPQDTYCAAVAGSNAMAPISCDNVAGAGIGSAVCIKRLPAL